MAFTDRIELLSLSEEKAEALAIRHGQPAYRGRQIYKWIWARQCDDIGAMSDLPSDFRNLLEQECTLSVPQIKSLLISRDGTRKYLVELNDGVNIEMVAIPHQRSGGTAGYTLCISTQAGCPMACAFRATGASGFIRNLTSWEIAGQVLRAISDLGKAQGSSSAQSISNIVFMGMGEPLLNYEESIEAVRMVNNPRGIGIGQRHIAISTAGLVPGINKLALEGLQVTLAISLHAANNELRDRLMPINRHYPIEELMAAAREYARKTGRRVSFEYVLLHNVNTARDDALRLAALVKPLLANINLIPYNPTPTSPYKAPSAEEARRFMGWVAAAGAGVTMRKEHGADIDAACGQLALRRKD